MTKISPLNNKKQNLLVVIGFLLLPYDPVHAALEGKLESVNCEQIKGWAWDNADPAIRVNVEIYDVSGTTSKLLTTLSAQGLRDDLLNAGKGDGQYGFSYLLPATVRNAVKHKISVRFQGTTSELSHSPKTTALVCYGKLNDTGIQHCSNASSTADCSVTSYKGQDGHYGRDAKALAGELTKQGAGNAGFDFTKIANDGSVLPADAALGTGAKDWACTLDNVSGLMWEVKTDEGGLRDKDNTYSWYNANNTINGGFKGYQNEGVCTGNISCDSQGYRTAVNALKLCGKSDWRVAKRLELHSIMNYGHVSRVIDGTYFPNTVSDWFWSSSPVAGYNGNAWMVDFSLGDEYGRKGDGHALWLVRGGQ